VGGLYAIRPRRKWCNFHRPGGEKK